MRFGLTRMSSNKKIGPIPASISTRDTCPDSCSLKGKGCYAEGGPIAIQWRRVEETGMSLTQFLAKLSALPRRQLWRYGTAGDLPERKEDVLALADANQGRPVLCYTHRRDIETFREASAMGFNINLSADSLADVDGLADTGLPVVTVLPSEFQRKASETLAAYRERMGGRLKLSTPAGRPVAICPATYLENVTCSTCQVCSKARPCNTVIGFPAHGARRKLIDARLIGVIGVPNESPARSSDDGDRSGAG